MTGVAAASCGRGRAGGGDVIRRAYFVSLAARSIAGFHSACCCCTKALSAGSSTMWFSMTGLDATEARMGMKLVCASHLACTAALVNHWMNFIDAACCALPPLNAKSVTRSTDWDGSMTRPPVITRSKSLIGSGLRSTQPEIS